MDFKIWKQYRFGGNQADYSAMTAREMAIYAQGCRCGHLESPEGDLYEASEEAAGNARSDYKNRFEWSCFAIGYYDGARTKAQGQDLPEEIKTWQLPEEVK